MNIYIQEHNGHAGKWIYNGYAHAWEYLDHKVIFINDLSEVDKIKPYKLFICDSKVTNQNIDVLKNSFKTYLYVQPNIFPEPWGLHPNFQCCLKDDVINQINKLKNVIKWNFGSSGIYHTKWKDVLSLPLAFDDINYNYLIPDSFDYDICFIGGIADNGFNEKIHIIKETLDYFLQKSGLKCAFAINQNLTHEQENYILTKSKIALNIHDAYQRKLGLDTNERTFKSLGCTGILISDDIKQAKDLFSSTAIFENDLQKCIEQAKLICNFSLNELINIKKNNQKIILQNHTYINRVQKFLSLS